YPMPVLPALASPSNTAPSPPPSGRSTMTAVLRTSQNRSNAEFPFLSRLLLAPDSNERYGSGVLLASDVASYTFPNTRVVVLASCESAAGTYIEGEGFDSVARLFLDAGVPAVVASLWPVDDDAMP